MFMAKFDYAGYIKLTFILLFPFIYLRSSIYVFIYFFWRGRERGHKKDRLDQTFGLPDFRTIEIISANLPGQGVAILQGTCLSVFPSQSFPPCFGEGLVQGPYFRSCSLIPTSCWTFRWCNPIAKSSVRCSICVFVWSKIWKNIKSRLKFFIVCIRKKWAKTDCPTEMEVSYETGKYRKSVGFPLNSRLPSLLSNSVTWFSLN